MSADSLDTLLAKFEAARNQFWSWTHGFDKTEMDARKVANWPDSLIAPSFVEKVAMVRAARRYVIARDFNVYDPGDADMLWKLQQL